MHPEPMFRSNRKMSHISTVNCQFYSRQDGSIYYGRVNVMDSRTNSQLCCAVTITHDDLSFRLLLVPHQYKKA